jgi:hypothetical protein
MALFLLVISSSENVLQAIPWNITDFFWIFDLLVDNGICSQSKAVSKIQKLLTINNMYASTTTRKEIEVWVWKWS